jgi:hypothetical protein
MNRFRLPRKEKKYYKGGKLWLYPSDKKGNSQMAFPCKNQSDYTAVKKGIVRNLFQKKESKKEEQQQLKKPIIITDKELRIFVDDVFAEKYRNSSYKNLLWAKTNPLGTALYYYFVNAYKLGQKEDKDNGNICCMVVDSIKDVFKKYFGKLYHTKRKKQPRKKYDKKKR